MYGTNGRGDDTGEKEEVGPLSPKERVRIAMHLGSPDRVPVMCQLSLGHYFLYSGVKPMDIWYTSEGFAEALIRLRDRYDFDGILVGLPGRDRDYERHIERIEQRDNETVIHWKTGGYTVLPSDDNPHYYQGNGERYFPRFEAVKPEELYYVEPWDLTDITYPYTWAFESGPRPFDDFFPEHHFDTIKRVMERVEKTVSVHSEVFSPWAQFLELLTDEQGLIAIMEDPGKAKACLERLTEGAIDLAKRKAACGIDAILISSAFAGAGFISRQHYEEFVLPFEKKLIAEVKKEFDIPIYTHTCGSIGDRLDLMLETDTNGIDTLDPPPLGTVDLEEAKKIMAGKAFIKGNIDPVNTLLQGDLEAVRKDVLWRLNVGKPGGGYILSTACSVAPHTPPENIELLVSLAEEYGRY
jgi:MtaA/CmuA family methyltransferase